MDEARFWFENKLNEKRFTSDLIIEIRIKWIMKNVDEKHFYKTSQHVFVIKDAQKELSSFNNYMILRLHDDIYF